MAYNTDPTVSTLAAILAAGGDDLRATVWSKIIEKVSQTKDDFSKLEGPEGSDKPIWRRNDLKADGGDKVTMSVFAGVAGPGSRGEQELVGNTSDFEMGTYDCRVDFWRDGVMITKKLQKMIATGKLLESTIWKALSEKLGLRKQYEMMLVYIRDAKTAAAAGFSIVMRPNSRATRDTITSTDTLTTSMFNQSKAMLSGIGGRPVDMSKSSSGSDVLKFLVFTGQDHMASVRDSASWQTAITNAGVRGDANPQFSGKLVDWNGMYVFEHQIVVQANLNDWLGSPIQPFGVLSTAITPATTALDIKFGKSGNTNTTKLYSAFFPGYAFKMYEEETVAADTADYYVWIVNPPNAITDPNKAGFYKYTGSSNNGNKITTKAEAGDSAGAGGRLGAATSGYTSTQIGGVTFASGTMTATHPVGAKVIPANRLGVPIGYSFVLGAGSGLRAYGSINAEPIEQYVDFKFVKGVGYESIYGQTTARDTDGFPRNYIVVEHAVAYPGITVPAAA